MQVEEIIIGILNETAGNIRQNMADKGINATGRTSLSVRVRKVGTDLELVGGGDSQAWGGKTAPFETIEIGRGPGGDYKKLRGSIYYWTIAKDMDFDTDSHRWAVATNISKNIVAHGTRRYSQHEDVYTTEVKDAAEKIRAELADGVMGAFRQAIESFNIETKIN